MAESRQEFLRPSRLCGEQSLHYSLKVTHRIQIKEYSVPINIQSYEYTELILPQRRNGPQGKKSYPLPGILGRTSTLLGNVLGFIFKRSTTIWPMSSGWIFQAS
jgi:hypothetical protein